MYFKFIKSLFFQTVFQVPSVAVLTRIRLRGLTFRDSSAVSLGVRPRGWQMLLVLGPLSADYYPRVRSIDVL